MPVFAPDSDYEATRRGYVAKGTIFCGGKPVEIFEAHGRTLPETAETARAKANEVCKGLKRAKGKKRALRKNHSSKSKPGL